MGMRFKKSKKIASGVKLNVSNKSVGVSVGGKGVHHSVSSSGRKTTTVSAPGTGLSYVKTSGGGSRKRKSSKKAQSGTVGCGTILLGFILFFLIVGVFSSGFSSGRKKAPKPRLHPLPQLHLPPFLLCLRPQRRLPQKRPWKRK